MCMTQHILITGAAGYIGSMLTGALLRRGDRVTAVDSLLFGGESLLPYLSDPAFDFMRVDVCTPGLLRRASEHAAARGAPAISAFVHLAAIVGFPACKAVGRQAAWKTNVEAVQRLYDESGGLGIERFLLASTYSVYGLAQDGPVTEDSELYPQSLYAETKIAAEAYLQQAASGAECAPLIYRFATLYGLSPRMRFDLIVNQFTLDAFDQGELVIFEGNHARSFVHVRDAIAGLLLGLAAPVDKIRNQIYNLGNSGGNFTKDEIAAFICRFLPETKVRYEELHFDGDMRNLRVSYEKIERELAFRAQVDVPQGIDEILHALSSGLISDPHQAAYRNAPSILS